MKELENRLSSREVAEMMEVEHKHLLRKIERINEDFTKSNIGFSKYWAESTYKVEGQLREYKEYKISKRGCEFLAHKTTGEKGNLFTDKYMDRFENMKEVITNNQLQIQNSEITKQIAEIVQAQLNQNFENCITNVDNKYSQYIRPTALSKTQIVRYIKGRLGIEKANDEYELVKRRIMISLGAKHWQDIPIEKLQASLRVIDECIDMIKKDRPYQQQTMF